MGRIFRFSSAPAFILGFLAVVAAFAVRFALLRHRAGYCARDELLRFIFACYLVLAASLTLFPIHSPPAGANPSIHWELINLVPFATTGKVLSLWGSAAGPLYALRATFLNIVGNLLLLLPFGFFAPMLKPRLRSLGRCLAVSAAISASVELLQLCETFFALSNSRTTDIDDLLLNVVGAAIGYACWRQSAKRRLPA